MDATQGFHDDVHRLHACARARLPHSGSSGQPWDGSAACGCPRQQHEIRQGKRVRTCIRCGCGCGRCTRANVVQQLQCTLAMPQHSRPVKSIARSSVAVGQLVRGAVRPAPSLPFSESDRLPPGDAAGSAHHRWLRRRTRRPRRRCRRRRRRRRCRSRYRLSPTGCNQRHHLVMQRHHRWVRRRTRRRRRRCRSRCRQVKETSPPFAPRAGQ